MASNNKKGGGRTTAKGTQPPVKAPKGAQAAARAGKGAPAAPAPQDVTNRQMRRAGFDAQPVNPQAASRLKLVLIGLAVVTTLLVLLLVFFFKVSGTWIGLLGLVAGLGTGFAVTTGRPPAIAERARPIAIGIAAVGVIATAVGVWATSSGTFDFHWPFVALLGCGAGAFLAEISSQQMTPPDGPPQSAVALLKRSGAQRLDAPSTGGCVWATRDARVRIIIGASIPDGSSGDDALTHPNVRKNRRRADLLKQRMAALNVESGVICVVDQPITTVQDGDDLICSAAGLTKALSRRASD